MFFGVPVSLVILIGTFFVLRFFHRKALQTEEIDISRCRQDYAALGPMRYEEKWMIFFFAAALLLWFFLVDLRFGEVVIPSWTGALGLPPKMVTESTVAMLIVMVLFFIPSRDKTTTLLTWHEVKKLPVGIIFLFGGGFAISKAVDESQLDMEMASVLSGLSHLSPILLVLILVVFMTLLSEFASNTASLQLVFPVLVAFVGELSVNPLEILVPVTLAASCGFMLPIATPPNTIVFGSERIKSGEMIRSGFFVDLIGIVSITLASFTLIHWIFS
jgi:sodium-dependent dicarboxylate transporter 2/3/5